MAQAQLAADALASRVGVAELVPIATRGDAISARRPRADWVAADGQFTRELERALLDRQVDVVVHSYKDLPIEPVEGLAIAAVLPRGDARDCLITPDDRPLDDLPFGARIGTSSPRRAAQLAAVRPDLIATPIRGNVETRIARLRAGEYDAVILAAAGLDRLGIAIPDHARLPFDLVLPAPAQGALALQVRVADGVLCDRIGTIDHTPTRIGVEAERALLRRIGGGCMAPLGALGVVRGSALRLRAALEDPSGTQHRAESSGAVDEIDAIVEDVARQVTGG